MVPPPLSKPTLIKQQFMTPHNTSPRVKYHFQLPSLLVHYSYQKKIIYAMHRKSNQFFFSFLVSLDGCDLFLTVLVYTCSNNKTALIKHEIVFNDNSTICFVSLFKKKLFSFFILFFAIITFRQSWRNCIVENEKMDHKTLI